MPRVRSNPGATDGQEDQGLEAPESGANMPESDEKPGKGPKMGKRGNYRPATYPTFRGNIREDR